MPLLALLLTKLVGGVYALALAMFGAKWAMRIAAATTIAGLYVTCAVGFTLMIIPWLNAILETNIGMLLGLLFPPVAGTVLASLSTFWACVVAKRYSAMLIKLTVT